MYLVQPARDAVCRHAARAAGAFRWRGTVLVPDQRHWHLPHRHPLQRAHVFAATREGAALCYEVNGGGVRAGVCRVIRIAAIYIAQTEKCKALSFAKTKRIGLSRRLCKL
jgi:hypothetical protein